MTIHKQIPAGAIAGVIASSVIGLAACSGGSTGTQDVGSNPASGEGTASRMLYARAIDGYLAGATVYVDQNKNAQLDAFEPRALTDNDGYFSYNHRTSTDYCATGGLSQYCLRGAFGANEEVLIRVTGGYDTVTQLPFNSVLSLRSSELNRDDLGLVTPITSMVADGSQTAEEKYQALVQAGIFQGSLNDDPFSNAEQMTRAQLAVIISRVVGEAGNLALGSAAFEDVQSDVWSSAYVAMATKPIDGVGSGGTFGSVLASAEAIEEIARRAVFSAMNPELVMPVNYELPNPDIYLPLL